MRLAALALALAACKPHPHEKFIEFRAKLAEARDAVCACKDKACAEKVNEGLVRWASEMAKTYTEVEQRPQLSDEETRRFQELGLAYADCMAKALGVPDAEAGR